MAGWEGMESVKDSLEDTRLLLCGGGGGGGEGRRGRGAQVYFSSCTRTVTSTPCNRSLISKLFLIRRKRGNIITETPYS